jgi:hypothetical protein
MTLRGAMATALLLGAAGCSDVWTVARISEPLQRGPGRQAVYIYGVTGDPDAGVGMWNVNLQKYDPRGKRWDHNCFVHNFPRGSPPATKGGETHYYAFTAPPGHYAFIVIGESGEGGTTRVFEAPAGQVTYLGTFDLRNKPRPSLSQTVKRRVDLDAAAEFARSLSLPPPRVAEQVVVDGYPGVGCSEGGSTFG